MPVFSTFYLSACAAFAIPLFILVPKIAKSSNEYKRHLIFLLIFGIASIAVEGFLPFIKSNKNALLMQSLSYITTNLLVVSLYYFTADYCDVARKASRIMGIISAALMILDISAIIFNYFKPFYFTVTLGSSNVNNPHKILFWTSKHLPAFALHFFAEGMLIAGIGGNLVHAILKKSVLYRRRYIAILVSSACVLVSSIIGKEFPIHFNLGPFFYSLHVTFLSIYTTYIVSKDFITAALKKYYESENDGIACFDATRKCVYLNRKARLILKYQNPYSNSRDAAELYLAQRFPHYSKVVEGINTEDTIVINSKAHHFTCEYKNIFSEDAPLGCFIAFYDRTEEIEHYKKDRYLSTHDPLTGLLNRQAFFDAANTRLLETPKKPKYLLASNIKDFRLLNELFGQGMGDSVLKNQAEIITRFVGPTTIVGHMGDDKFALLVDKELFKPEALLSSISQMKTLENYENYQLKISVGITDVHGTELTSQVLYEQALMALDSISDNYQRELAYYDSTLMEKILAEKNIVTDFDHALSQNQFQMYLQPIIDSEGKAIGAEALSRWLHPIRGLMMPISYINVLEKSGLIHLLDLYMWDLAFAQAAKWEQQGVDKFISINVSHKDLFYLDISSEFSKLREKHNVSAGRIQIEFKETTITEDFSKTMLISEKLQQEGFKIIIDNFGIAYSSLNILKDINANVLKIGSDFLREGDDTERNTTILQFILSISKVLGMQVIAEGVESAEKLNTLKSLGCSCFQGFYYSRPVTVKEFEERYL